MFPRLSKFSSACRATFLVGLVLLTAGAARAQDTVSASANFVPAQIQAGQMGELQIVVTGSTHGASSPNVPDVPGLVKQGPYVSTKQNLTIVNGHFSGTSTLIYDYKVRADKPGTYKLPQFTIEAGGKTITVNSATLEVSDRAATNSTDPIELLTNPSRKDLYVGENYPLEITLAWRNDVHPESAGQLASDGDAFETLKTAEKEPVKASIQQNGQTYTSVTWHAAITPIKSGDQTIHFTVPVQVVVQGQDPFGGMGLGSNMFAQAFGQQQNIDVESTPLDFNVQPLPTDNQPANFTGGIGQFTVKPPSLSSSDLQVGQPITLKLTVSGQGNFDRVEAPAFDPGSSWRSYPPKETFEAQDPTDYRGTKTFEYVIMPMSDKITEVPSPEFNFFDPDAKKYIELSSPPIAVTVKPAPPGQSPPTPLPTVNSPAGTPTPGRELVELHPDPGAWEPPSSHPLYASPLFLASQALPAIFLTGLVIHRRRQLRLANDPAYARRLQAQKLARAAVERARAAAAAGQAAEFYATAQRALQEAASHDRQDAAEALTWTEFDTHLAERGISTEIRAKTREIFEAGDALRFGGFSPDKTSLAEVATRLDGLVQQLLRSS